tara:strand:- start:480 stop:656 length:177 start_codon:yes stop_codon:yes gene_type:complete
MYSIYSGDNMLHTDIGNEEEFTLYFCSLALRYFYIEVMITPVGRMPFIKERVISLLWE